MNYKKIYKSALGNLFLLSDGKYLTGLYFENQKYFDENLLKNYLDKDIEIFEKTFAWLALYFSGKDPKFRPDLKFIGSEYRKRIWKLLLEIDYGKLVSYKDLANAYNKVFPKEKTSPRAVGNAVSHNPISIIVPCHRVIGSNKKLTGYAGGLDRKVKLLELEKVDIKNLSY